jgi:hypothetical protein
VPTGATRGVAGDARHANTLGGSWLLSTGRRNRPGHGVVAAVLFLGCYAVYGTQPKVGATTIAVVSAFLSRRSSAPARAVTARVLANRRPRRRLSGASCSHPC